jgi:hypothetical protein
LIGQGECLLLVVCDVDGRCADLAYEGRNLDSHALAQIGIEVREWLVTEQETSIAHEGPGQGNALLLTTGELTRVALSQAIQTDALKHRQGQLATRRT